MTQVAYSDNHVCVEWPASKDARGYGHAVVEGRHVGAHRLSYAIYYRKTLLELDGKIVRHLCDNPPCINPAHLAAGTQQENVDDCVAKGRNQRGARHHAAKLTESDAANIRAAYRRGTNPANRGNAAELAEAFGVSRATVGAVVRGDRW